MRHLRLTLHACATNFVLKIVVLKIVALAILLSPLALTAQTNCEAGDGPLNSAPPQSLSVPDLIQKFAAQEAIFKEARNHYTYTQDVTVETLDGDTVDGKFRETTDVLYDDQGKRIENVTYAPMNTLTRVCSQRKTLTIFAIICRSC
ncbi:MAG: hypothetical protein ACRD72_08725 [Candidatus Angelobacter sp.]